MPKTTGFLFSSQPPEVKLFHGAALVGAALAGELVLGPVGSGLATGRITGAGHTGASCLEGAVVSGLLSGPVGAYVSYDTCRHLRQSRTKGPE